jgi:hypothetical protein
MEIIVNSPEEAELRKQLETRTDADAKRMLRFLSLPDLSRTEGSPLKEAVDRATKVKSLEGFDMYQSPRNCADKYTF